MRIEVSIDCLDDIRAPANVARVLGRGDLGRGGRGAGVGCVLRGGVPG